MYTYFSFMLFSVRGSIRWHAHIFRMEVIFRAEWVKENTAFQKYCLNQEAKRWQSWRCLEYRYLTSYISVCHVVWKNVKILRRESRNDKWSCLNHNSKINESNWNFEKNTFVLPMRWCVSCNHCFKKWCNC